MTHTDLRLRAEGLDFWVDVHLHRFGRRWLAVADLSGDAEVGWGNRPAAAIAMALTGLGAGAQGASGGGSSYALGRPRRSSLTSTRYRSGRWSGP